MKRFWAGLARAVAFTVLSVVLWWLCAWGLDSLPWIENELVLTVLSLFPAVIAVTAFLLALGEMKPFTVIGLPWNRAGGEQLAVGVALGAGIGLSIVAVQWLAGWVDVVYRSPETLGALDPAFSEPMWAPSFGVGLAVLAIGAAGEELLFRGYGFQQLMRATHPWVAVAGTAVVFGLMHRGNPDLSPVGLANTMLFGFLFGLALVRHRSLWLPFGMHFGWNFSLATIGANVSGIKIRLTGLEVAPAGGTLWTGGDYGPEASLLSTVAVVFVGVVLWRAPLRQHSGPVLWDQRATSFQGDAYHADS